MITGRDSWKVKRIRNTRGSPSPSATGPAGQGRAGGGVATIPEDAHIETVYAAIGNRYGLLGKVFNFFSKLRRGQAQRRPGTAGPPDVAATFAEVAPGQIPAADHLHQDGRPKPTAIWGCRTATSCWSSPTTGPGRSSASATPAGHHRTLRRTRKAQGEPVEAVARVLPKSETRAVYNKVLRRYWNHAWWFYLHLDRPRRDRQGARRSRDNRAVELTGFLRPPGTPPCAGSLIRSW